MCEAKITTNLHSLASQTTDLIRLVTLLHQGGVLGRNEFDLLKCPGLIPYERCTELYIMIIKKGEEAYQKLLRCLKESGNTHVVNILESGISRPGVNAPVCFEVSLIKSYVERSSEQKEYMTKIWEEYLGNARAVNIIVITGMAGIGKTEFAKEFALNLNTEYKANCILINAENDETQLKSYLNLTSKLGIGLENRENPDLNLIVEKVFQKFIRTRCVYILDNVLSYKDPLVSQFHTMIKDLELKGLHAPVVVILTSRFRSVAKSFGDSAVQIPLSNLTPDEAYQLVSKSLDPINQNIFSSTDEIQKMCNSLDYHPFAIQQAVSLIKINSNYSSIKSEIQKLNEMIDKGLYSLVLTNPLPVYQQAESSMHKILGISLKTILKLPEDTGKEAVKIMKILSLFSSNIITIEFLYQILLNSSFTLVKNKNILLKIAKNTCMILSDHSMCTVNTETWTVSVPRLIQETILIDLKEKNYPLGILQKLLPAIKAAKIIESTDSTTMTNLTHLRSIWNHVLSCQDQELLSSHSDFPGLLAERYDKFGEFRVCESLTAATLKTFKHLLGENHEDVLWLKYWRGCALEGIWKLDDALTILHDTFDKANTFLGEENDLTLRCAHVIGTVMWRQKRNAEANNWYSLGMESRRTNFGNEHHQTLALRNDIALILADEQSYEKALTIFENNFEILERTVGSTDSETLSAKHNIGWMKFCQKKYSEAFNILKGLLDIKLKALHENHPDVFNTKHLMARALKELGRYREAAQLFREAYEGRKCILGTEHENTTNSLIEFESSFRKSVHHNKGTDDSLHKLINNINCN